ncbi:MULTISPECIES: malonyl-ACP O-methyltransferase BioC [unclassified Methylotenera]|jgi:malonyl-CoA O-methyltransferase|uniref:malonyl-ACP O-methyltransferase BioC n=1 Tax=unclassified Methylotenera TaxID=2643294 RepID=UPI00036E0B4B|nr:MULTISPECIES: malonyl-ACP O-methyltransferase BioC [unclassified Methylotenera]
MQDASMKDAYWIDKARVRASFERAAHTYDAAAVLQKNVREEMLDRLDLVNIKPQAILDAGCGTGHGSFALHKRFPDAHMVSLDLAMGMLQQTYAQQPTLTRWMSQLTGKKNLVCADIEALPLASASVDIVWSNLALQWCNDLDQAFTEIKRVLKPNGLLMFSTFGPDTLRELRIASAENDTTTHVSRFIDMHDIGDAMTRAGFNAPVLDVEHFTLTYDDVKSVMRDLKSIGAHNATAGRVRGLVGKGFFQQLATRYEQFRLQDGKLPATFEVVYGHAWKSAATSDLPSGVSPIAFRARG